MQGKKSLVFASLDANSGAREADFKSLRIEEAGHIGKKPRSKIDSVL